MARKLKNPLTSRHADRLTPHERRRLMVIVAAEMEMAALRKERRCILKRAQSRAVYARSRELAGGLNVPEATVVAYGPVSAGHDTLQA